MKSELPHRTQVCTEASGFGDVAVVWSLHRSRPRMLRIFLSRPDRPAFSMASEDYPDARPGSCHAIDRVMRRIQAFLEGEPIRFELDPVRMDLCSPFKQRVLRAEHGIPRGLVSTYGRLARYLGSPGGARAVGNCLATNPFPIVIPCHRAIRSDGTLGGYQGGTEMKRALLEMEGITFGRSGRAVTREFFY